MEFRKRFRRKRLALFKSGQLDFHQDNNCILVTDFLSKMGIKTVPHPPYSPDLTPWDFWLFPKVRLSLWDNWGDERGCDKCHVIAHGDEEVRLILSSRIEWEYQAVKKWPLGRNVGHTGEQMFALKWPQVAGHRKGKEREAKWLAGTPKRKWGSLPLSGSK